MVAFSILRLRVITALVLAPVTILAVLKLPAPWFALVWAVVLGLAAWELCGLGSPTHKLGRAMFVASLLGVMALAWWTAGPAMPAVLATVKWPLAAFWLVISMALRSRPERALAWVAPRWLVSLIGGVLLLAIWAMLVDIRLQYNARFPAVLYLLMLIWTADTFAYLFGARWGRAPLSPISPNKTNEGLFGGLLASAVFALVAGVALHFKGTLLVDWIVLAIVTVLFSVTSDLLESLAKRWRNTKDSGELLPGHGGVLDRIDGLIGAIPIFYLGLTLRLEFVL